MHTDRRNYDSSISPSLNNDPLPTTIRRGRASASPRALTGTAVVAAKELNSPSSAGGSWVSDESTVPQGYGEWIEHIDPVYLPVAQARNPPLGRENVVWPDHGRWYAPNGQRRRGQAAFHLDSHTIM